MTCGVLAKAFYSAVRSLQQFAPSNPVSCEYFCDLSTQLITMNCVVCKQTIIAGGYLQCYQCCLIYHYQCLKMGDGQFAALSEQCRSTWLCLSCNNVTRRTRVNLNNTVCQAQISSSEESMNMSLDNISPPQITHTATNAMTQVSMENISSLLDQKLNASMSILMDKFRSILTEEVKKHVQAEIESVVKKLQDEFSETTDHICADQSDLKFEMKNNIKIIKDLETENLRLKKDINSLDARLSSIEKMSRSQNLEIQAVPESKNENVMNMFLTLCKTVNTQINNEHIISSRRVAKLDASKDRPRNILITLSNSRLRDQVISACRRYNKSHKDDQLNSAHLGLTSNICKVYVCEHVSPECKKLHAATRLKAKELNYKYVWVKYGRVYVRRADRDDHIHIKNLEFLNKLH